LLQNAGTAVNRARITVARNTQRVSMLDFRIQLEKTLQEIEEAYWQLVQAERELLIQEELFRQTADTADILQRRAGVDVSRVILGQTNAALRFRESQLVELRYRLRTLSNAIKVRVNDPSLPLSSAVTILPEDPPILDPIRFDLAEQLEAGLTNRAELVQQQIRIDSANVVVMAAKNNLLPSLNLVGSIGLKGADDVYSGALSEQLRDMNRREYAIGFQLEVPLGNREPRAILRRTENQRMQAIWQYKGLIERVCQEVRDAHDQVYSGWERVRKTRQATLAARESLDAINQEQNVGQAALTPDFVNRKLQAQEQLAQSAREEARAITDYNVAISQLEKAKGTILKYDNIIMAEEPLLTGGIRVRASPEAR
jgi:outer membrane protein TolC